MKAAAIADARGGRREPDRKPRPPSGPGKFSQREDMSKPAPQGVAVPPGLAYGQRQVVEQAQGIAPAPNRRTAISAPPPGQQSAPGPLGVLPPSLGDILIRPSRYPDEPVTTGLLSGPGAGPEVLAEPQPGEEDTIRGILMQATDPSLPPDIRAMATFLSIIEGAREGYERRRGMALELPSDADFLSEPELSELYTEELAAEAESEPVEPVTPAPDIAAQAPVPVSPELVEEQLVPPA